MYIFFNADLEIKQILMSFLKGNFVSQYEKQIKILVKFS